MNILDQVIIAIIIVGAIVGLFRGFFKEVAGTIGLLVAAIVANYVSPYTIPYFGNWISNETLAAIIVWLLVFVVTMLIMNQIAALLSKLMSAASLGWINRLAGFVFAAIKYCLLIALVISVLEIICAQVDLFNMKDYLEGSSVVPKLHSVVDIVMPWCYEHILHPALELLKK